MQITHQCSSATVCPIKQVAMGLITSHYFMHIIYRHAVRLVDEAYFVCWLLNDVFKIQFLVEHLKTHILLSAKEIHDIETLGNTETLCIFFLFPFPEPVHFRIWMIIFGNASLWIGEVGIISHIYIL